MGARWWSPGSSRVAPGTPRIRRLSGRFHSCNLKKPVIFDPTSNAIKPVSIRSLDPYNPNSALQQQHLFRAMRPMGRQTKRACHALTGNERALIQTIKPLAAQILGGGFEGVHRARSQETDRAMHWRPDSVPAICLPGNIPKGRSVHLQKRRSVFD